MNAKTEILNVKEITVSFGGTVNLGSYENFKIDLSVTVEADEDAAELDIEQAVPQVFAIVRGLVRDEVAKLESHNTHRWLRDTDLKAEKPAPSVSASTDEDDS